MREKNIKTDPQKISNGFKLVLKIPGVSNLAITIREAGLKLTFVEPYSLVIMNF